jgi:sulfate-transporting ATPase
MAGLDKDIIEGEATPMPNLKLVSGAGAQTNPWSIRCVSRRRRRLMPLQAVNRLEQQVYAEYAEPDADFDKLAAEQALVSWCRHRRVRMVTILRCKGNCAADALRIPPGSRSGNLLA